jgi:hypothetical protein
MQMVSTAKGDRSCKDVNVSTAESKTGRKVEQPWKNLQKSQMDHAGNENENHILNRSVASASVITPLDTTCIFGLVRTRSASRWLAYRPETGGREASASVSWTACAIWDLERAILYDFEFRLLRHSPANIGYV